MPKLNHTKIILILDKSGSMSPLKNDTIGTVNNFIIEQRKAPGTADISIVAFNRKFEKVVDSLNILDDGCFLTKDNYNPSGSTALYETLVETIDSEGRILDGTREDLKPEKVVVVIMTDGENTDFIKYSRQDAFDRISHQSGKYNWQFVYLGANQDAFKVSSSLGISRGSTITYLSNPESISKTGMSLNSSISRYRSAGGSSVDFTDEEQKQVLVSKDLIESIKVKKSLSEEEKEKS
jgi:uncharacterized protein YegL